MAPLEAKARALATDQIAQVDDAFTVFEPQDETHGGYHLVVMGRTTGIIRVIVGSHDERQAVLEGTVELQDQLLEGRVAPGATEQVLQILAHGRLHGGHGLAQEVTDVALQVEEQAGIGRSIAGGIQDAVAVEAALAGGL